MKKQLIALCVLLIIGCKGEERTKAEEKENIINQAETSASMAGLIDAEVLELTEEEANQLAKLPLACISTQYPNKLGQTLGGPEDIKSPQELHPSFYGCFDWHSSVHAHWSLVKLLKHFPQLEQSEKIAETLKASLSRENIAKEIEYFKADHNQDFERTYGWAWLLKLAEELNIWDTNLGAELSENIKPLADLIVKQTTEFLPKLNYPIRSGEHTNTAFALSFAYDYAVANQNEELKALVENRAQEFYLEDKKCPIEWEPSGFDFLSPCLEEVDIMRRVLPKAAFSLWMDNFLPQLKDPEFTMEPGIVTDREDGKLVHLDGLNFSRAWVFYGLANQYPEEYSHLIQLANEHMEHSYPNLVGDTYEGGHWLGSFALYALEEARSRK